MIKTKTILKDKFWIMEEDGVRVGTLSISEDKFMFSGPQGTKYFDSERALKRTFGKNVLINEVVPTDEIIIDKEVKSILEEMEDLNITGNWVYGKNKPRKSRRGYIATSFPGIGFK